MGLGIPKYIFENITKIEPDFLKAKGIKYLALDVDNTLTGHGSHELSSEINEWLEKMHAEGFKMMVASNNVKKRVEPFAEKLGLEYKSFCCKPSPFWLWGARSIFKAKKKEIALIGDQIFTDLLAGQLYGANVFLVEPLYEDIKPNIIFKRKLEKPFKKRYYKKGGKLL